MLALDVLGVGSKHTRARKVVSLVRYLLKRKCTFLNKDVENLYVDAELIDEWQYGSVNDVNYFIESNEVVKVITISKSLLDQITS